MMAAVCMYVALQKCGECLSYFQVNNIDMLKKKKKKLLVHAKSL